MRHICYNIVVRQGMLVPYGINGLTVVSFKQIYLRQHCFAQVFKSARCHFRKKHRARLAMVKKALAMRD